MTAMSYFKEHEGFFNNLLNFLEYHLGTTTEIVLHDYSLPYEHTIIDIRNGYISGRKVGDCVCSQGYGIMKGQAVGNNEYNSVYSRGAQVLRHSTMYITDKEGKTVGALCFSTDITELMNLNAYINKSSGLELFTPVVPTSANNKLPTNVNEVLEYLLENAKAKISKEPGDMTKVEKIQFLAELDKSGAFQINKSGERVCEYLGISKFTFYKYLDYARKSGEESAEGDL
jgi:predicted transcriptional regulator YheO